MLNGRPTGYNPEFHCKDFIEQSTQGKSFKVIAASWGISRKTLWLWTKTYPDFCNAVEQGREMCEAFWEQLGFSTSIGQAKFGGEKIQVNVPMYKWLTGNMFGWSHKVETKNEHSGGSGGPIQFQGMTKEQIKAELQKELEHIDDDESSKGE